MYMYKEKKVLARNYKIIRFIVRYTNKVNALNNSINTINNSIK